MKIRKFSVKNKDLYLQYDNRQTEPQTQSFLKHSAGAGGSEAPFKGGAEGGLQGLEGGLQGLEGLEGLEGGLEGGRRGA